MRGEGSSALAGDAAARSDRAVAGWRPGGRGGRGRRFVDRGEEGFEAMPPGCISRDACDTRQLEIPVKHSPEIITTSPGSKAGADSAG